MDVWRLTEEELDLLIKALQDTTSRSKTGTRLLAEMTAARDSRRRSREEDEEWQRSE